MSNETLTTSATGGQKGTKAQRYDLLAKPALDAVAEVLAFGAEKYDSHNWRKGYEWGKSYAALMRHMTAFWDGETYDAESGLSHLAHAGCHVMFMLTWLAEQGEQGEFDDRYVAPEVDKFGPFAPIGPEWWKDLGFTTDDTQFWTSGEILGRILPKVTWRDPEVPSMQDRVNQTLFDLSNDSYFLKESADDPAIMANIKGPHWRA